MPTIELMSREVAVVPEQTALLVIDVQNFNCKPQGGVYRHAGLSAEAAVQQQAYFFDCLQQQAIPNMQRLQQACRRQGIEVIYTVIESLTQDGRDRSLDYKITGFNVPKGSWDAAVIEEIQPASDEIVFPKSSSSLFISTNVHYILGNLGIRYLIICGCLTDQCISSAVRDACDLGYLVTLVPDACATHSLERHTHAISHIQGYCRQRDTAALLAELEPTTAQPPAHR